MGYDSFEYMVCDDGTPQPVECDTAVVVVYVRSGILIPSNVIINIPEDIELFPNPVGGNSPLSIKYNRLLPKNGATDETNIARSTRFATEKPINISILNLDGRVVFFYTAYLDGNNRVDLNLPALTSGLYLVQLESDGERVTKRITVIPE